MTQDKTPLYIKLDERNNVKTPLTKRYGGCKHMNPRETHIIEWKESWGRGIEKINKECEAAGVPIPEYRIDTSGLMVKFHTQITLTEKTREETPEKTSGKTSGKILSLMRENPHVSIPQIAEIIGRTARAIEMQVAQLKAEGLIERVGPAKGGHWAVKEDA